MQRRASDFVGYTIEATEGKVGAVADFLFDDQSWTIRWLVIDTGSWLATRKVLINPRMLDSADVVQRAFPVKLSRREVEDSPALASDAPVSLQMDRDLSLYYGCPPTWNDAASGDGYDGGSGSSWRMSGRGSDDVSPSADSHLRSLTEVTGYRIHALDGDIGHLDDLMVDDENWNIDYAVIDTKNWGFGKHVLVSPTDITEIDWGARDVRIDLTRYKIKSSPSWQAPDWSNRPAL